MTLYEIDNNIRLFIENMLNSVDENGEVKNIDPEELEQLQQQRDEKYENIACWIKNLDADIKALKEEEANLAARRKAAENKRDRLKKLLSDSMTMSGVPEFSTAKCKVSFRTSEGVIIPDDDLLDKAYMTQNITYKPDKEKIKAAIKSGADVRGAYLETRSNIQIK